MGAPKSNAANTKTGAVDVGKFTEKVRLATKSTKALLSNDKDNNKREKARLTTNKCVAEVRAFFVTRPESQMDDVRAQLADVLIQDAFFDAFLANFTPLKEETKSNLADVFQFTLAALETHVRAKALAAQIGDAVGTIVAQLVGATSDIDTLHLKKMLEAACQNEHTHAFVAAAPGLLALTDNFAKVQLILCNSSFLVFDAFFRNGGDKSHMNAWVEANYAEFHCKLFELLQSPPENNLHHFVAPQISKLVLTCLNANAVFRAKYIADKQNAVGLLNLLAEKRVHDAVKRHLLAILLPLAPNSEAPGHAALKANADQLVQLVKALRMSEADENDTLKAIQEIANS